jgi:hypothetical protein
MKFEETVFAVCEGGLLAYARQRNCATFLMGHQATLGSRRSRSALPPKADIDGWRLDVRFVPLPDIGTPYSITSLATC